jgi:hypothetical protein
VLCGALVCCAVVLILLFLLVLCALLVDVLIVCICWSVDAMCYLCAPFGLVLLHSCVCWTGCLVEGEYPLVFVCV